VVLTRVGGLTNVSGMNTSEESPHNAKSDTKLPTGKECRAWVQDVPWPEITPYTISKSALKATMRGFARELAPRGIRANAIAPGIVAVGMAKRQWDTDPEYRARAERAIPLGHMQPPESVAHAFLFLCSEMASYMTGSVLLVDGGCSLYPMD
jgi:NAD(P)-dependent dehydrogenase (short-subunit alcohol dehydrogenase family)